MKLADLIKQEHFASPAQEALLNVIVTGSWIMSQIAGALAPHDITPAQYNVLRILRGSHPDKMMCSAVGERLLDRTPDVTRLLNRLEAAGLIERRRAVQDRRIVEVNITQAGLDLLEALEERMQQMQADLMRHLSAEESRVLSDLLERLRMDQKG
jgi:DNA-binding MarR family transcriptional regulator